MSQEEAKAVARLLDGLTRLAKLAEAMPEELLAAWLAFDAGLSKTQARQVASSLKKLIKLLQGMRA